MQLARDSLIGLIEGASCAWGSSEPVGVDARRGISCGRREVAALCGQQLEKTRGIAQREGISLATDDVAALCREVDVVVVASPDGRHHNHVRTALDAGCQCSARSRSAMTLAQARELAAAAESGSRRRCAVSFPYRQLPPLMGLRAWLPGVREIDVTLRSSFVTTLEGSGDFGGVSHVIDAALWLDGG